MYRHTHQLFLGENVIYMLIFRLDEPLQISFQLCCFWINSIFTKVEQPKIVLVGTHADRVSSLGVGQEKRRDGKHTLTSAVVQEAILDRVQLLLGKVYIIQSRIFFRESCASRENEGSHCCLVRYIPRSRIIDEDFFPHYIPILFVYVM